LFVRVLSQLAAADGEDVLDTQRVRASVARSLASAVCLELPVRPDVVAGDGAPLLVHLRCRAGLEPVVADEVRAAIGAGGVVSGGDVGGGGAAVRGGAEGRRVARGALAGRLRLVAERPCCVVVAAMAPFTLAELHTLRCFDTVGFPLDSFALPAGGGGTAGDGAAGAVAAALVAPVSAAVASSRCERLMAAMTRSDQSGAGGRRYRLALPPELAKRGLEKKVGRRAFALNPRVLNDAVSAARPSLAAALRAMRPRIAAVTCCRRCCPSAAALPPHECCRRCVTERRAAAACRAGSASPCGTSTSTYSARRGASAARRAT
jgi:hypothetical protein